MLYDYPMASCIAGHMANISLACVPLCVHALVCVGVGGVHCPQGEVQIFSLEFI